MSSTVSREKRGENLQRHIAFFLSKGTGFATLIFDLYARTALSLTPMVNSYLTIEFFDQQSEINSYFTIMIITAFINLSR